MGKLGITRSSNMAKILGWQGAVEENAVEGLAAQAGPKLLTMIHNSQPHSKKRVNKYLEIVTENEFSSTPDIGEQPSNQKRKNHWSQHSCPQPRFLPSKSF